MFIHKDQTPRACSRSCCLSPPYAVGEALLPWAPLGPVFELLCVSLAWRGSAWQVPLTSAEQRAQGLTSLDPWDQNLATLCAEHHPAPAGSLEAAPPTLSAHSVSSANVLRLHSPMAQLLYKGDE